MRQNKVLTTVYNSMFIVISLILGFFGRLSIFPVFPFLKLSFADIPVFLATLVSGIPSGILVLLISSGLRTIMFSSAGWLGFIMRANSIIMVVFIGLFYYKNSIKKIYKILWLSLGILICLTVKLIFNYFVWIGFFSVSRDLLDSLMLPMIIPYNLLKLIVTVGATFYLENPVKKILKSLER